jgi:hypothetical protein
VYATKTKKNAAGARCTGGPAPEEAAMFTNMFRWLKIAVSEVPEDIAVCEFDCAETECRVGDWEHCKRRLQESPGQRPDQDGKTDS